VAPVDPRVTEYAHLLVDRCLGVQAGWQVRISATPLARPLVEECVRLVGARGAYPLVRLSFVSPEQIPFESAWAETAPEELLPEMGSLDTAELEQIDAWIRVLAPENSRDAAALPDERRMLLRQAFKPFNKRFLGMEVPWVGCAYPTQGLAQDAGMTLAEFEDFLYGSCLLDWDAERERMATLSERFDGAETVRIVGAGTDISLSVVGRAGVVDDGHVNMPGGEFFFSPLEDSAEGVVHFTEFRAAYQGHACSGVRLRFERGLVVDASAESDEAFLVAALDADEGARRLGELGIGCNPGIQRHIAHPLFDEKIDGTVHLAVGAGIPFAGGLNQSAIHWDMVKDLRRNGRIELDGETVQENGTWLI
jgi:aminopeptidase